MSHRDEEIKLAIAAGDDPTVVAARYGLSVRRVYQIVGVRRCMPRMTEEQRAEVERLHAGGMEVERIASRVGVGHSTVSRIIAEAGGQRQRPRGWTEAEIETVRTQLAAGRNAGTIARLLGRDPQSVRTLIRRL